MKTKMLFVALEAVTLLLITPPGASAKPHSRPEHITLHLEPEMFKGHRLVLTLEPIPAASNPRSDSTAKSLVSKNPSTGSGTEPGEASTPTTTIPPTTTSVQSFDAITTIFNPYSQNDTTEASTDASTVASAQPIIKEIPRLPPRSNVDEFIITVPNVKCPPGEMLDPSGKCRPVFHGLSFNIGRSFSSRQLDHFPASSSALKNALLSLSPKS